MARQYFNSTLADSLITPQSAVSPATSLTAIFSAAQCLKFLSLPYGQNAPSPGQVFHFTCGGLVTTPASGTVIFSIYHGSTTGGTLIATSDTITMPVSATAGYFRLEGDLVYRTISEVATTSTCWYNGWSILSGPSGGTILPVIALMSSNAAVSVDTTGTTANSFGSICVAVTPSVTASTWTPEIAYSSSMN